MIRAMIGRSVRLGVAVALVAGLSTSGCGPSSSAKSGPEVAPDGRPVAYYANGQRQQAGRLEGGRESGPWTQWYSTGQRKAEGSFVSGERDGAWTYWHENGQVAKQGSYIEGQEDGRWIVWYESGQRAAEGDYQNGERHGVWTYWSEEGKSRLQLHTDGVTKASTDLVRGLGASNEVTRSDAIAKLQKQGLDALPALALALKQPSTQAKIAACELLGRLGAEARAAAPLMASLLSDTNADVRRAASRALVTGDSLAVDAVLTALAQPDIQTQYEALETLGGFTHLPELAAPPAERLLAHPDSEMVRRASETLSKLAPTSLPLLIAASKSDRPMTRGWCYRGLAPLTGEYEDARTRLIAALGEPDEFVQPQLIAAMAESDPMMIDLLLDRLTHAPSNERQLASRSLGRIGAPAIDRLVTLLSDPRAENRYWAAISLGEMGSVAKPAIAALQRATDDNDPTVRNYAATALRKIRG